MSEFPVDYFIRKFEAIPEEKFTVGGNRADGCGCALVHCGGDDWTNRNPERLALGDLFKSLEIRDEVTRSRLEGEESVWTVNDGGADEYDQLTPKARILAALQDIKAKGERK